MEMNEKEALFTQFCGMKKQALIIMQMPCEFRCSLKDVGSN
jgi:hypothetical protein